MLEVGIFLSIAVCGRHLFSEAQLKGTRQLEDRTQCQQSRITYRICFKDQDLIERGKGREGKGRLGKKLMVIKGRAKLSLIGLSGGCRKAESTQPQ